MEMEEYLAHYGVKGMRWGRRKGTTPSDDHKKVAAIRKKKVSEMSNTELREALNRMKMQNEYAQNSKQLREAGKSKASKALKGLAKVTVKSIAVAGVLGGAAVIGKKLNLNDKQTKYLDTGMKIAKIILG